MKLRHYITSSIVATVGILGAEIGAIAPAQAETCTPLKVVGSQQVGSVEKTVSAPGAVIVRSNWNTDFAIGKPQRYTYYITTVTAKSNGEYDVEMFLKYPDGSADEFYNREAIGLDKGDSIMIRGEPRSSQEPFQINVEVGGLGALGDNYTISAYGCR